MKKNKYELCRTNNIKLVRIKEELPLENIQEICDSYIVIEHPKNISLLEDMLNSVMGLLNLKADINLKRDKNEIQQQYLTALKDNSVAAFSTKLVDEWNYEKNGSLLPSMFSAKSGETVWWKCQKGHEWQAKILNRANGTNCPYCNNSKVLKGFNDLATINPRLATQWDYNKNGNFHPDMVLANSNLSVWWMCEKGHSWKARISNRNKGIGCARCGRIRTTKLQSKPIRCIETNTCYESIAEAQRTTGIVNISRCLNGRTPKAGGYHWEYIDK